MVGLQVRYLDDIYVGYRYYDTKKVVPQFAFGHGLSYTSFQYSNLVLVKSKGNIIATFNIKNSGQVAGADVAQLYVSQVQPSLPRPEKELKGFKKVFLKAGEKKSLSIVLDETAFQYYDDTRHQWVGEPGKYIIKVGNSSDRIFLTGTLSR